MGYFQEMKNAPKQAATRKCRDDNLHSYGIFLLTIKATNIFHKETKTEMQLFSSSPFLLLITNS